MSGNHTGYQLTNAWPEAGWATEQLEQEEAGHVHHGNFHAYMGHSLHWLPPTPSPTPALIPQEDDQMTELGDDPLDLNVGQFDDYAIDGLDFGSMEAQPSTPQSQQGFEAADGAQPIDIDITRSFDNIHHTAIPPWIVPTESQDVIPSGPLRPPRSPRPQPHLHPSGPYLPAVRQVLTHPTRHIFLASLRYHTESFYLTITELLMSHRIPMRWIHEITQAHLGFAVDQHADWFAQLDHLPLYNATIHNQCNHLTRYWVWLCIPVLNVYGIIDTQDRLDVLTHWVFHELARFQYQGQIGWTFHEGVEEDEFIHLILGSPGTHRWKDLPLYAKANISDYHVFSLAHLDRVEEELAIAATIPLVQVVAGVVPRNGWLGILTPPPTPPNGPI